MKAAKKRKPGRPPRGENPLNHMVYVRMDDGMRRAIVEHRMRQRLGSDSDAARSLIVIGAKAEGLLK